MTERDYAVAWDGLGAASLDQAPREGGHRGHRVLAQVGDDHERASGRNGLYAFDADLAVDALCQFAHVVDV